MLPKTRAKIEMIKDVDLVKITNIVDLLVFTELCASKTEARNAIKNKGIFINDEQILNPLRQVKTNDFIEDKILVLRWGKKRWVTISK